MDILLKSPDHLKEAAASFLEVIGECRKCIFIAEMGAGKTTFILALLDQMGVKDASGSPTFSLVNEYSSDKYGRIYHLDLYRLEDEEEALDMGIEEILYGDAFCFIEWPEKIEQLLPDDIIRSYIRRNEDNTRTLTVNL